MSSHRYNRDYYEDGVKEKISAYENYRWMPERSIREAISLIRHISFMNVLDFGCAKGFLVYALRLLGKDAYGVDISEYAIQNSHDEVRKYLKLIKSLNDIKKNYDLIVAKDVLEHLNEMELDNTLNFFRSHAKKIFFVVPLGDKERYRIREYEMDTTHILRKPEEWWLKKLHDHNYKIEYFDYKFDYIKEHWTDKFAFGNAFFIASIK